MDGHYTILNRQQEVANVFIQQNKHKLKTHNLICVCVCLAEQRNNGGH